MSDTTIAEAPPVEAAASPLGRMLGLDDRQVAALGVVFTEAARAMGLDGAPIFERLNQGQSLGRALAMPDGVGDLLYFRAHRWFSVGRADKAEPLFRTLCILDGSCADHWVGYGVCLRLRQSLDDADTAFEVAAKLRSDWAVPHFHALELAVHREQWDAATQRLARYDERATADIAEAIQAEVERLRSAVALKQDSARH
jgi:hypothetical protein